jgi:hypothetical protein
VTCRIWRSASDAPVAAEKLRELPTERLHDRWSGVNAAVNAIYLHLGEQRDRERVSAFEGRSRAAV